MTVDELKIEVDKLKTELAALRAWVKPVVESHAPHSAPMPPDMVERSIIMMAPRELTE